jgi:hypothetical protein
MRWSLLFAALGVLAAYLLLVLLKIQALISEPVPEFRWGIAVGLITLCLSAALLGRLAGKIIYLSGNNIAVNLVIGLALALACLIVTALAGSAVGVILFASHQPSFVRSTPLADIGAISLLILLWGGVPAALLGFLYGALVKVILGRKLKHKPELQSVSIPGTFSE